MGPANTLIGQRFKSKHDYVFWYIKSYESESLTLVIIGHP